jgi:hypothetical protein
MKHLPLALFLMLFAVALNAQTDDCNLLIHKSIKDEFVKSTKKEYLYNVPNRVLGVYLQNRNGYIQATFDWDISPKALDATQKFDPNKPLMVTFLFKDGTSLTLTLEEFNAGKGATKVRYANYMIGASTFLTPEQVTALTQSPIVAIRESIYGIPFDDTNPLRADFWIRTIQCVQP